MLVIVGLVFLVVGLVAVVGTLGNAGADHPPTEKIAVFGCHPTGSTGTLFLLRIVIGVVVSLFFGAHRSASRAAEARRAAARFRRQRAFVNRDRDTRLEHQRRADATARATSGEGAPNRRRNPLQGRRSRDRQPVSTG